MKSRLLAPPPTFLLALSSVVTFPPIVLSKEQLEGGLLSVRDSCDEEEEDEETDPVFRVFPSPGPGPGSAALVVVVMVKEVIAVLILVVPFMMLL